MKAIVRFRYGGPEVLEMRDVDTPTVRDGEVLVRVQASSVSTADIDYLRGRPLFARFIRSLYGVRAPRNRGLGLDVAGQVEAVGRGVGAFRVGDEVFGDLTEHGFGAFAEYASAPPRAFAHTPAGLTFEEAATLPHAAVLAMQGLRSGRRLEAGESVLINGASGSVGPFAVQIAKALGAEVTGVCSEPKMDLVRSLGADHVIDYTREDFTESGRRYDRILDLAGHRSIFACRRALRDGGTYLWVGGSTVALLAAVCLGPLISMGRSRKLGLLPWRPFGRDDVRLLTALIETGKLRPVVDRRYALDQVPDALRYLEAGYARGKVVITVGAAPTS
jgi:NADPH:quinone reductase-like Zn-dependent oxidoreductase